MLQLRASIVLTFLFVVFFGVLFPLFMTGIAQAFPGQAHGSLVTAQGRVVGSSLIGQNFTKPEYFHPRPSAAGNGYDANSSGGTNLGPISDRLVNGVHKKTADGKDDPSNFDGINDLAEAYREENGLAKDEVLPADAITRSGSGLDPHISPANAELQAARVAKARNLPVEQVKKLITRYTDGRFAGVCGDPGVNVLQLNLALDRKEN